VVKRFKLFLEDESGATAIEYVVMTSLIAMGIVAAVTLIGSKVSDPFSKVANGLN
jgi:pilus assembly protein Flp/PilA